MLSTGFSTWQAGVMNRLDCFIILLKIYVILILLRSLIIRSQASLMSTKLQGQQSTRFTSLSLAISARVQPQVRSNSHVYRIKCKLLSQESLSNRSQQTYEQAVRKSTPDKIIKFGYDTGRARVYTDSRQLQPGTISVHSASRFKYSAEKYPDLAARIAEAVALQTAVNASLEVSSKPEMPFQLEPDGSSVFTDKLKPPAQVKNLSSQRCGRFLNR